MNGRLFLFAIALAGLWSCKKNIDQQYQPGSESEDRMFKIKEDEKGFVQIGSITIGGLGAAEISAFDPLTKRLFVVNNNVSSKIDVLDFSDPAHPIVINSISMAPYGGLVNSVAVHNGLLAAAVEALNKTNAGKVIVFKTQDLSEVRQVSVGSLPDMVTFSPNGRFILTANEGEPASDYSIDPPGTVSIISVHNNYAVTTLDFSGFNSQVTELKAKGLRIFGPNATMVQNIEPEYITVSEDSRIAWVTLQENNAIAKIDLTSGSITDIFPLGFKNYQLTGNELDPTDRPLGIISFGSWPVKGMYLPDAIAVLSYKGVPYIFTANEGDAREYSAFAEEVRVSSRTLDPTVFPNAAFLKLNENLGRLNITSTMGDTDGDGDYDELYSFGSRSFSVWNGLTGANLWDSKNDLDTKTHAAAWYDDDRSDSKGVEPEGIVIGEVNKRKLAFVGMERADAIAIYDVTLPTSPVFVKILRTGDAPEGLLFISAKDSPINRSLLVVSSENDGKVSIYAPPVL